MSKFKSQGQLITDRLNRYKQGGEANKIYVKQVEAVFNVKRMFGRDREDHGDHNAYRPSIITSPFGKGFFGMMTMLPYVLGVEKMLILTPSVLCSDYLENVFGNNCDYKNFMEEIGIIGEEESGVILEQLTVVQAKQHISRYARLVNVSMHSIRENGIVYKKQQTIPDMERTFESFDLVVVAVAQLFPPETWTQLENMFCKDDGIGTKLVFFTTTVMKRGERGNLIPISDDMIQRTAHILSTTDLVEDIVVSGVKSLIMHARNLIGNNGDIRSAEFVEKDDPNTILEDVGAYFVSEKCQRLPFRAQGILYVSTAKQALELERKFNENLQVPVPEMISYAVCITGSMTTQSNEKRLTDFTKGRYQIAILYALPPHGYSNDNISLCVLLKNLKSPLLFSKIVDICICPLSNCLGQEAVVLSYSKYNQKKMWDDKDSCLARENPFEYFRN